MFSPEGIIVPIVTPMNEDETFNEEQMRVEIRRLIKGGVKGIFTLGTNGEVYAMDEAEKTRVIQTVIDEVNGQVPVYAGTGCVGTKDTIAFSLKVQDMGVDALSIVSPYFVAVSQDDIYRHFAAVAKAVKAPIVLYNLPARTGNNINYTTVKKLAEFDTIVGVKDSSGNFDNTLRYLDDTDPRLKVLAGNDSLILSTLMAGGTGAISGWSNVFPKLICSIYDHWRAGRLDEARQAQNAIRPFRDVMGLGNPNSVVKRAMNLLGHPVGPAREPASGTDPKIDEALAAAFENYRE